MKKQFKFERCSCVIIDYFTHQQQTMINKKQNIKHIAKRNFAISIKNNDNNRFDSRGIERSQSNHKREVTKNIRAFSKNRKHIDTMQKSSKKLILNVYKK